MPTVESLENRITETATYKLFLRMLTESRTRNSFGNILWLNKVLDNLKEIEDTPLDAALLETVTRSAIERLSLRNKKTLGVTKEHLSDTVFVEFLTNLFQIGKENNNSILFMLSLSLLTTYSGHMQRYTINHADLDEVFQREYPHFFSEHSNSVVPARKVNSSFNRSRFKKPANIVRKKDAPPPKFTVESRKTKQGATEYILGSLTLNSHGEVTFNEQKIIFSPSEICILQQLMIAANTVVNRNTLIALITGPNDKKSNSQQSAKLNGILHSIRANIGRLGLSPKLIKSVRGEGYLLDTWKIR